MIAISHFSFLHIHASCLHFISELLLDRDMVNVAVSALQCGENKRRGVQAKWLFVHAIAGSARPDDTTGDDRNFCFAQAGRLLKFQSTLLPYLFLQSDLNSHLHTYHIKLYTMIGALLSPRARSAAVPLGADLRQQLFAGPSSTYLVSRAFVCVCHL